jgi:hypothetical protein
LHDPHPRQAILGEARQPALNEGACVFDGLDVERPAEILTKIGAVGGDEVEKLPRVTRFEAAQLSAIARSSHLWRGDPGLQAWGGSAAPFV